MLRPWDQAHLVVDGKLDGPLINCAQTVIIHELYQRTAWQREVQRRVTECQLGRAVFSSGDIAGLIRVYFTDIPRISSDCRHGVLQYTWRVQNVSAPLLQG